MDSGVKNNLDALRARIRDAARAAGRDAHDVTLVAVSKMQSDARIDAALAAGQRIFGENKVQEAQLRWEARRGAYPDLRLHMIGPLQSNKAADAVALFDVIQTVDRPNLARALAAEMKKQRRRLPCLIQVNTGAEPQKAGVLPDGFDALYRFCRDECALGIRGLMCIPPHAEDPAPHFALLRTLASRHALTELSMGMSGDFETAIAQGATAVRVGTALFGER